MADDSAWLCGRAHDRALVAAATGKRPRRCGPSSTVGATARPMSIVAMHLGRMARSGNSVAFFIHARACASRMRFAQRRRKEMGVIDDRDRPDDSAARKHDKDSVQEEASA